MSCRGTRVVVIKIQEGKDHAKEFYSRLEWRLDADRAAGDNFRLVQFTPPAPAVQSNSV